jgi:hypothetical protein
MDAHGMVGEERRAVLDDDEHEVMASCPSFHTGLSD